MPIGRSGSVGQCDGALFSTQVLWAFPVRLVLIAAQYGWYLPRRPYPRLSRLGPRPRGRWPLG